MRYIFILLLLPFTAISQEKRLDMLPVDNGSVTYTSVVQVEGVSKSDLFERAKKWFVLTYNSSKDVIQLEDKESGEIVGKGNFDIRYYSREPYISYTITIMVKDGRYKYRITDFSYNDDSNRFIIENFPKSWAGKKKLYKNIDDKVVSIIQSIEKFMSSSEKDIW